VIVVYIWDAENYFTLIKGQTIRWVKLRCIWTIAKGEGGMFWDGW
jgi:hypothetical protein